ncbi:hypothetical protein D915_009810 [Fasciola hepatica]|uniref:Uncharacterized protein n=1 Tax=Fasciola hepatica TaxID=6192 RepID=A0A4E0QY18_FASHE|nr:hypothetical protein D915_009810 [Fasciola hepatica]
MMSCQSAINHSAKKRNASQLYYGDKQKRRKKYVILLKHQQYLKHSMRLATDLLGFVSNRWWWMVGSHLALILDRCHPWVPVQFGNLLWTAKIEISWNGMTFTVMLL